MSSKIFASGIMTETVVVANVNNTFSQVMEFFTKHRIQHLPVADGDTLIGIISDTDMLGFIARQLMADSVDREQLNRVFRIEQVMTPHPVSVTPDTPLEKILEILSEGRFQSVPVVQDGIIKGIITNKDIVRVYHWERMHQ